MPAEKSQTETPNSSGKSQPSPESESQIADGHTTFPNEGRFRLAFDSAPMGMAIVGLDYRLLRVNRALCEALAYDEKELLASTFLDITHPDDKRRDADLAEKLLRGEIPSYRLEKRYFNKKGALVWLDLTAVVIRNELGEPLYALAMVEDITERRRADEALRTSEERYRSFIVNSSEGIWRFETEQPIDTKLPVDEQIALFYKYGYLAECNDAMARMYGHERADDIVGARFGDFALAANPANVHVLRDFISNGYRLQQVEITEPDLQRQRKCFSTSLIGIVVNGFLLRVWGTQRDETQRKTAETELEHSHQQLRALAAYLQNLRERERSDIAREMHDVLGQSLTALKIDMAWIKKSLPDSSNKAVLAGMTNRLNDATRLLNETIAAVKTLSTELRPGVLDKFGLAAAVEWQCHEFDRRTGIKSECQLPTDELHVSPEGSTAIFRILQEALSNVARHSTAKNVSVELNANDQELSLIVRDDGRGITNDEARAPDSLGLLGMRERAQMVGGNFTVYGKPMEGTTVQARIPVV